MNYISVSEAVQKTGKSQPTISRFCRKHEKTKHIKKEDGKYLIDESFLFMNYSGIFNEQEVNNSQSDKVDYKDKLIDQLEGENRYLRSMISTKDDRIRELHQIVYTQTKQLEAGRQSEPIFEQQRPAPEKQPVTPEPARSRQQNRRDPAMITFYIVTGVVMLVLIFAILFREQIKAALQ